jgi:hypothetical protein
VTPNPKPIESSNLSVVSAFSLTKTYESKSPLTSMKAKPIHPLSKGIVSIGAWNMFGILKVEGEK